MPSPHLNRRDLLASLLGLPLAAAAGCGPGELFGPLTPALPPAGEIIGASHGLGHRLRDGFRPQPPADRWQDVRVVIVGGGIAGLAAARRLERAGLRDFVLLELEPLPGGTSCSGTANGIPCPWGAHYLPAPLQHHRALIELLAEMGVVEGTGDDGEPVIGEQFLCRDPEERLFVNGAWHEGLMPEAIVDPEDRRQFQQFQAEIDRWADWRDGRGRRAFTIPVAACSDDPEVTGLDRMSMSDWLAERRLTSPRLRWMVDYSCRDDYGLTVDQTSAWAGVFYFASRLARAGAAPQPLITWPEGNGRLAAHLAAPLRDRIRLGMAVTEILPETAAVASDRDAPPPAASSESRMRVIAVNSSGDAVGLRAERVIFAAPQFLAPHLVQGYRAARGAAAAEFEYGAWLVANLSLTRRPVEQGFSLAWDNVLYDSPSLGYVVATHQQGRDHGPTVWTYYHPLCDANPRAAREKLLSLTWAEWADVVLSDLERAHPDLRPLVARLDITRWGHAMIRPRPGFVWHPARRQCAEPWGSVHFAHSDLSGVALFEEAFHHGNRAAEEVLAACGMAFDSVL